MFPAPRKRGETIAQFDARVQRDRMMFRGGPGKDQVEEWIERERAAGRVVKGRVVRGVPVLPGERD